MVSVCGGVWVAELINLDEDQHQHNIHHGGVKLETDVAETDMDDCTDRFCSVFFRKEVRLDSIQDNENNAIDNVTTVTDVVIEIINLS